MLIRFAMSNFLSIDETVELSMVAVDQDRPAVRPAPSIRAGLLRTSAIYGPNASGKTNVLAGLSWLQAAVRSSLHMWDDEIPIEPFAFGNESEPSEFALELLIDDVRFEYVLALDTRKVHYEALFHYPQQRRRRVFEREGNDIVFQRGLGNLSGTRELLTDRVLALSVARRFDEPLVKGFSDQVRLVHARGLLYRHRKLIPLPIRMLRTIDCFDDSRGPASPGQRDRALELLRLADLGIEDVIVDEVPVPSRRWDSDDAEPRNVKRTRLVHRSVHGNKPLEMDAESHGTQNWFRLIGPILGALEMGSVLMFDELDASLHPTLSAQLISMFNDPSINPHGAQLIFTSHDTSLLNHLNRDEVWLTEKTPEGATRLGALAEFAGESVRKSQNLERAYLHGRFGALPDVDRTDLLRSLGLIG